MTTFNPLILQETSSSTCEKFQQNSRRCFLYWRQRQLLVLQFASPTSSSNEKQPPLPPLSDPGWLLDCLQRSPIQRVRIDPGLGEATVKQWADVCEQAGKDIYLRLPSAAQLPQKCRSILWGWKRALDWAVAALLLVVLSPLLVGIAIAIALSSPGAVVFSQWRVGQRGKLFRVLKFRTMVADAEQAHHGIMANQGAGCLHKREDDPRITPLGKWLRRYSLDELPQLINVLRGEMSLVGPRPWALYDAVRIRPEMQERLNALPGITGAWQVEARSTLLDLDAVNRRDLEYLKNWSLGGDFKILLQTVPKVLSGFGAF
ncbi:sugar transferase [Cyanobacteria bacterium FACHB-DQ100]|uniref:heterocyst development glycosyltransferase HepC n=1 Tax=Leptolyngbya sp. DQ-M1 TaxID=2933920 RepID=UPI00198A421F|nr:sugar transferase [Cyanobacteria bacterium FACHB-DQ100]